jgi:hypothetical protein
VPGCADPSPGGGARSGAFLTLLALAAPALPAQTPGLPVFAGGMVPGLEVGAAMGTAPAAGPLGRSTAWTGSVDLASRRLGLRVSAGALDPRDGTSPGLAGGALGAVRVLAGGVQSPLSIDLLGGYGIYNGPETVWRHGVVGAAFILAIPTPLVSLRPWLSPRLDWRTVSPTDGSVTESALGGSAGVDVRLVGGLVLRAAWDKTEGTDRILGFGAAYHF